LSARFAEENRIKIGIGEVVAACGAFRRQSSAHGTFKTLSRGKQPSETCQLIWSSNHDNRHLTEEQLETFIASFPIEPAAPRENAYR
jgi:hypothetical protein